MSRGRKAEVKKVVLTGGHLTPALAVLKEFAKHKNWRVVFFGRRFASESDKTPSLEAKLVPEAGGIFLPLDAGRVETIFSLSSFLRILLLPWGFLQAFYYLLKFRPRVIISFGGYLSVPVVIAGWLLGIPAITHEQTSVVGLGTGVNARFAKKIAISWPNLSWQFPKEKTVLTGNPILKDLVKQDGRAKMKLKLDSKKPLLVVTGGNQGSHIINQAIKQALPKLLEKYNLFHQTGHPENTNDFQELEQRRKRLAPRLRKRYQVKKYFFGQEWGVVLRRADLIISRAGANILTELALLGKPMLLIPIPWLKNREQLENAKMFKKFGVAEVLNQEELTPRKLVEEIDKMIEGIKDYRKDGELLKKKIKKNAAKKIFEEAQKLV